MTQTMNAGVLGTVVVLVAASSFGCASSLRPRVERTFRDTPEAVGMAVVVLGPDGQAHEHAVGSADPDGRALTVETPLRIASNTKTYVAATALRLVEKGLLDLDASLAVTGDPAYLEVLAELGYRTDEITVRHLLMHVAGMPDHADDAYAAVVMGDPAHVWSRVEQVRLLAEREPPLGAPGTVYRYSDTGYVILGDILERATHRDLAGLVRAELRLNRFPSTWWERQEDAPAGVEMRAHQYVEGTPVSDIDPSADLFGGGGLLASTRDLATFMRTLFDGGVFDEEKTLELMRNAPGHPSPERYRIGLQPQVLPDGDSAGTVVLGHNGFWGTIAWYVPDRDVAIAGAVLDRAGLPALFELMSQIVADRPKTKRSLTRRSWRSQLR
jgi:D-alanyl-D-alanine carboxypeptidase